MKTRNTLRDCTRRNEPGDPARAGFTMLEILLAMSVLVIIMLMLTTIFDQSASTWESGMRETSRALEGRTILNLVAADLEAATLNTNLYAAWGTKTPTLQIAEGNRIAFFFQGEAGPDGRALKLASYAMSGTRLQKSLWDLAPTATDPYDPRSSMPSVDLLDNVDRFAIYTPGGATFTTNLPEWVDIELVLTEDANAASDIQVWSFGPNGIDDGGEGDDIVE